MTKQTEGLWILALAHSLPEQKVAWLVTFPVPEPRRRPSSQLAGAVRRGTALQPDRYQALAQKRRAVPRSS